MKPFVVSSRAVSIRVQNFRFVIDDYFNRVCHAFPPHELPFDFLVITNSTGNLSLSAIKFLMAHKVPVLFIDWGGASYGSLTPAGPTGGTLQIAQLRAYLDPKKRRYIAGKLLEEKFAKSIQLLRHLQRYYPSIDPRPLEREVRRPPPSRAQDIHGTLMTKEARVAVAYFGELGKVVQQLAPEFGFRSRGQSCTSNNMSASDPFNVCLNVAYGVLECWVRTAVNQAGFNEGVGFLHEAQAGGLPLAYDMQEPFRWLADYSLIQLLEKRILDKSDFSYTQELRLRMKPESVRMVVERMAFNFGRKTPADGSQRKYDTVLVDDTRKLARFLTGSAKSLSFQAPFVVDEVQADARLREQLLNLTVEERKKLGIPKTTYFYIRKNALSGKSLRLYKRVQSRLAQHDARST
jgi:CRISP-associated protein Cas1